MCLTCELLLRVEAGVALLDEKYPGWECAIDLATLRLSSCTSCVLGQLYPNSSHFLGGLAALNLHYGEAFRFGFILDSDEERDAGYPILQRLWMSAILQRRNNVSGETSSEQEKELVLA